MLAKKSSKKLLPGRFNRLYIVRNHFRLHRFHFRAEHEAIVSFQSNSSRWPPLPLLCVLKRRLKIEVFSRVGWWWCDVVNPCFTPAAQCGRVTVQPVIYLRCCSFLHHWPPLTRTHCDHVSVTAFGYSREAEHWRGHAKHALIVSRKSAQVVETFIRHFVTATGVSFI